MEVKVNYIIDPITGEEKCLLQDLNQPHIHPFEIYTYELQPSGELTKKPVNRSNIGSYLYTKPRNIGP